MCELRSNTLHIQQRLAHSIVFCKCACSLLSVFLSFFCLFSKFSNCVKRTGLLLRVTKVNERKRDDNKREQKFILNFVNNKFHDSLLCENLPVYVIFLRCTVCIYMHYMMIQSLVHIGHNFSLSIARTVAFYPKRENSEL